MCGLCCYRLAKRLFFFRQTSIRSACADLAVDCGIATDYVLESPIGVSEESIGQPAHGSAIRAGEDQHTTDFQTRGDLFPFPGQSGKAKIAPEDRQIQLKRSVLTATGHAEPFMGNAPAIAFQFQRLDRPCRTDRFVESTAHQTSGTELRPAELQGTIPGPDEGGDVIGDKIVLGSRPLAVELAECSCRRRFDHCHGVFRS